jgi:hypothetical protein
VKPATWKTLQTSLAFAPHGTHTSESRSEHINGHNDCILPHRLVYANPARWIAAARRPKLQSPSVKRVDAAIPCPPWPPRHTSSPPPSSCYTSFAPSAHISPSSNSEVIGRRDGRVYGCSRRRAAVRCTSVSQRSIASMVSTPRDMAFSRYHSAGKSRAHSPSKKRPACRGKPDRRFLSLS